MFYNASMTDLPKLIPEKLIPTRDYLRDIALSVGSLQRGFLPEHPREWQHGLEVKMRGFGSQMFMVNDEDKLVLVDLVRHKIRIDQLNWKIDEYSGLEIFNNFKVWLQNSGQTVELERPEFSKSNVYEKDQASAYAEALWWLDHQFKDVKAGLKEGVSSPVLLYPHHFDLALNWFPWDDERQINVGWSTGDEFVLEPYVYLTIFPVSDKQINIKLPNGAYWQTEGFSGVILPYEILRKQSQPDKLLGSLVEDYFTKSKELLSGSP